MYKKTPVWLFMLLASVCCGAAVQAQTLDDTVAHEQNLSQWGVGVGAAAQRSPITGVGDKVTGLPIIYYNTQNFRFFGNAVDWKLGAVGDLEFALRAKLAGDVHDSSDAPILYGMAKRNYAVLLGATMTWATPWARLSLDAAGATSSSKGQTASVNIEHGFQAGRFTITPHANADWLSDDYVDYYFGVRPEESTLARRAYNGKATVNVSAAVRVNYALTQQQTLSVDVGAKHYGSGITDSPLVERSSTPVVRLGYLYRF